jgi:hypothetical protein
MEIQKSLEDRVLSADWARYLRELGRAAPCTQMNKGK